MLGFGSAALVVAALASGCDATEGGSDRPSSSVVASTTSPSTLPAETTAVIEYEVLPSPSAGGRLIELHAVVVIGEQAPVLEVEFEDFTFVGAHVEVEIRVLGVLWAPATAQLPGTGASLTARMGSTRGATMLDAAGRSGVVIIDASGELLAAGVYVEDGQFATFRPGVDFGVEFLATAVEELDGARSLEAVASFDRCADPEPEAPSPRPAQVDHRQGLFDLLTTLGDRTFNEYVAEVSRPDGSGAEQIALDSGATFDAVVADHMDADEDYIRFQLENGVPQDELEIRYVIPYGWDLTGVSAPARSDDRLLMYDGATGRLLGHGSIRSLAGAAVPFSEASAPDPGSPVHVFVLPTDHRPECGPPEGVPPDIVVPYDDFAGSGRVILEVVTASYRPLTASEYHG